MSLEYKPSLGFVETAASSSPFRWPTPWPRPPKWKSSPPTRSTGCAFASSARVTWPPGQAAVETGALLAQSLNGLNGYNIIPSPAEEPDSLMDMLEDIKRKKAAGKAAKLAVWPRPKAKLLLPPPKSPPRARPRSSRFA